MVPLLDEAGHAVVAPDPQGQGKDATPVSEPSMQGYADRAGRALDERRTGR